MATNEPESRWQKCLQWFRGWLGTSADVYAFKDSLPSAQQISGGIAFLLGFIPAVRERVHLDFREWFSVFSTSDLISLAAILVGVVLLVTGRGRRREQGP